MRFHIMHKKINQPKEEYRVFFETVVFVKHRF